MEHITKWIVENPVLFTVIIVALLVTFIYNNLNSKKNRVKKSFSNIDTYLEQRFDEINSLIDQTLTAYDLEEKVQTEVAALRSGIDKAKTGSINDKVQASNQISAFAVNPLIRTEAYPTLQSIATIGMHTAQRTSKIEDEINAARRQYNNNASSYNALIVSFPTVLIAKVLGFKEEFELFKVSEGKKGPAVSPASDYLKRKYENR